MPVAKTYEKMPMQCEPFNENGKMYVNVLAPKGIKKVRWYSETEYKRMYPEAVTQSTFNARQAFGFGAEGYITLYKGTNVEAWAENDRTNIWRNLTFGYYTPGRLTAPALIERIIPIKLTWDEVALNAIEMKSHEEVTRYVNTLLMPATTSEYKGNVNEWIQETVKIREKKSKESHFGTKHTYILEDATGNTYVWETGTKDYESGKTISLKMKVKEHKEIGGEKVTVVWYCKEI